MEAYQFDTVVMGAGIAGLRAAVAAASQGANHRVAVLTSANESSYGGCSWKTHGTNAAMNSNDSTAQHAADTFNGGGKIGSRTLAATMAARIPSEIQRLELKGVAFDKAPDGSYSTGYYGGSTQGRSIHSKDMAGKRMVDALLEEARIRGVYIFNDRRIIQLAITDAGCAGAFAFNMQTNEVELFMGSATISAMGGGACVWPISTISADKEATGFVQAFEAGCRLVDMEMVQFHPTGLHRPGVAGHGEIMEEELRSQGAKFLNGRGERFMFRYDPRGERATRDIVARAAYSEMMAGATTKAGGIIFDLSSIDRSVLAERFPFMTQRLRAFGVDILNSSTIEISPAAHFVMGGLEIAPDASTSIPRLFACGEDAGGIHGGNRLGGNGVADALVFGAIAGEQAAALAPITCWPSASIEVTMATSNDEVELNYFLRKMSDMMWRNVGPVRNAAGLQNAKDELSTLWNSRALSPIMHPARSFNTSFIRSRAAYQKMLFATMVVNSSIARTNSVGAHFRTDADGESTIYNVVLHQGVDGLPEAQRRIGTGTMEGALPPEMAA